MSWLIVASPFIFGGSVLLVDFIYGLASKYLERRATQERNARLQRLNIVPFRGAKDFYEYDDRH